MPDLKRLINDWDYYYFGKEPKHISWIVLNSNSIHLTTVWQTYQLIASKNPSDAIEPISISWSSSNTSIATVNNSWLVTCVTPWDCTITATDTIWWYTATCSVSIIHVTWVSLSDSYISLSTIWQTYQLTATITPSNATNQNVTWSSSDTSVATVDWTWLVTCVTLGSCTITVTTQDWWYTATCSVVSLVTTTDYTINANYTNSSSNITYYYWVKFTALKSGKIKAVWFYWNAYWTLRIAQWAYASVSWTEYSISPATNYYTLSTPFDIVAWQNYVVSLKSSSGWNMYFYYKSGNNYYPINRTAVQYNYSTFSNTSTTYSDRAYNIKYLVIDYAP